MKRFKISSAIIVALLALAIGRASAVTMAPPQAGTGFTVTGVACPALATVVPGTTNLFTLTDPQCIRSNLSNGWTVVQTPQVLTPAATVTMDLSKGCNATIAYPVAGQNITLTATNIGVCQGKTVAVFTTQPASGTTSNTLTFSTGFTANATIPAVKTGTSATDAIVFADNGSALMYPVVGSGAAGSSTTPSFSTVVATGSVDKTINASNGGHISNPIGTGVAPTTGTGTVVAGGTDTAMRVTGGTSPVTVTFGTAFAVAPVCACSNGTTAADGCKTSAEGTGSVVVTTAGTDTFSLICIGK